MRDERGEMELAFNAMMLFSQLIQIGLLCTVGLIVFVTEWINPAFFDYPYLQWTSIGKILHFWPLMLYALVGGIITMWGRISSSKHDELILTLSTGSDILAGIWEELGFRCLFVCIAMICIALLNWLLSTAFALVVGETNLVYWCFDRLIVPVVNFMTFHEFETIFYGDYPRLFVFGMIVTNVSFCLAHQGRSLFPLLNSWIIGCIMIYATLIYGLWTAICLHALYDLELTIVRYVVRKYSSPAICEKG